MRRGAIVIAVLVGMAACSGARLMLDKGQETADLRVRVQGIEHTGGNIRIAVFGTPDGFPGDIEKADRTTTLELEGESVEWVVSELPTGLWAVAVLHDEDGNGEMNTGFMGRPTEGWGASNDAKGNFGPPSFEDSAIDLGPDGLTIDINMGY